MTEKPTQSPGDKLAEAVKIFLPTPEPYRRSVLDLTEALYWFYHAAPAIAADRILPKGLTVEKVFEAMDYWSESNITIIGNGPGERQRRENRIKRGEFAEQVLVELRKAVKGV